MDRFACIGTNFYFIRLFHKEYKFRKSVEDLRNDQKLGRFTRQMIFKRTEMEWKSIPKSYPIPPPRS